MALYDALNDDDDEVRDVAAAATVRILGGAVAPLEAAARLLDFLTDHYGKLPEFRHIVVCRLAGVSPRLEVWPDVRLALDQAINVDDSLFAEEEQNLFIDEVRELRRFQRAAGRLSWGSENESLQRLLSWTSNGVTMMREGTYRDHSPLGLASDQHYFALCARLIISGVVLGRVGSSSARGADPSVQGILQTVLVKGETTDFHGSLTAMAEGVGFAKTR